MISIRKESRTPLFHCAVSFVTAKRDMIADLLEDVGNLLLVKTETSLEDVVGLGDELHVSVLDTVVDHLDVVTRSSLTNPVTTWLSLGLSSGLFCDYQLERSSSSS